MADAGEPGMVTDLTRQLAGTLDRVATRIGDGGLRAVGDDVRDFARRQPGLFLLGAGVAGFVVARAVRAAGATSSCVRTGAAASRSKELSVAYDESGLDLHPSAGPHSSGRRDSTRPGASPPPCFHDGPATRPVAGRALLPTVGRSERVDA